MQRILLFFFISLFFFFKSYGQIDSTDKKILDSLLQNDEFMKMINDDDKSASYFKINVAVGNQLYSSQNKAVKNLQNASLLVISPSIGYYHKSGMGISLAGDLLTENNKTDFYQYSVTPSYTYSDWKFANVGFYYSHYFIKNDYSTSTSPIQDEFYTSVFLKKTWLKPGVAVGYSSGKYHEVIKIDTVIRQTRIKYIDTVATSLSSFSIVGSLQHSFEFSNLFSKNDGIVLTPQFSLITGINNFQSNHKSSLTNYNTFTKKKLKKIRHFISQSDNDKYQLQSIGFDMDVEYLINKFYIEPDVYFDYYLPKTNDKRFSRFFNLIIGFNF